VSPATDTVIIRSTLQLTATLRDSANQVLSGRPVAWSVSNTLPASVAATGAVTGLGMGEVEVVATAEPKSDTARLTFAPLLTVGPRLPSLFAGDTVRLVATLRDAQGGAVTGLGAWQTRQPLKASVNGGVISGVDTALATIVASAVAAGDSVVVAILRPRTAPNREIEYLHDTTRADGQGITELRTVLPGQAGSVRVSPLDEFVNEFDWSPDGSRVAVTYLNHNGVGKTGLHVLNADGTGEVSMGPAGSHPRWSPDGSRIADRSGTNPARILVAQANGTGAQPVTSGSLDDLDPEWSPDGHQLAFRRPSTFCDEMWIMDADGSHARRIVMPIWPCWFAWAPDGKEIAIVGAVGPWQGAVGVWSVRPDGTGVRALSPNCDDTGACPGPGGYGAPDWLPDGSGLVITGSGAAVVVSRGSQVLRAISIPQICCSAWSPDATKLVYGGGGVHYHMPSDSYQPVVGVMDADGANQTLVTDLHLASGAPQWRP
jgi:dipeptidyl aminopeptidase/acylaminoacyl peptidase